ncbi:DoxX family protein [Candidatus Uhrbacteria bacterium]|nr:DoxX family protein [Candidatus Uhrbacteria bacterium]
MSEAVCKNEACKMHRCHVSKKHLALLLLRLGLGAVFIVHGYGKLFGMNPGMEMFTGMVAKLGFPMPVVFAYAAALTEFLGGIAMVLGLYTHIVGWFIAFVMLVAFSMVKKFGIPAGDADLSLLIMAVSVALMGPGKYSLMSKMGLGGGCSCGDTKNNAS